MQDNKNVFYKSILALFQNTKISRIKKIKTIIDFKIEEVLGIIAFRVRRQRVAAL